MIKKSVLFFLTAMLFLVSCTPGGNYYYNNEDKTLVKLRDEGISYIKSIYGDKTVYSSSPHYSWSDDGEIEEVILPYYSEKLKHEVKVKFTKKETVFTDEDLKEIKYGYWEPSSNYYFYVNESPIKTIYSDVIKDWFDDYKVFVDSEDVFVSVKESDKDLSEEQLITKYKKEMLEGFKIFIAVYYNDTDYDQQTEAFLWDLNRRCRNIEPGSEYTYLYNFKLCYMQTKEDLDALTEPDFNLNIITKKHYSIYKKNILDY